MWSRKKQGQSAAPKAGITVDPKQSYLGGRVSKKVMWIGGLLTALILSFVVTVIAGKGQRAAEAEAVTTKSGNDNQMGLNDILSSAPSTNVVMQTPATPSASTTSPGKTGTAQGNTGRASQSPEEDPSIRQARLAAEREALRIVQLKQQQFEAALASNGRVNVELDDKAQANASPQDKYQQALADLKAAQNSLQAASAQPDPNKQDSKIAFTEDRHSNTYLTRGRETPLSPLELKIGTVIPATLISGINSDLPGQVIAQVNQNVYDTATHSTILLPQGSKLYGVYDSRVAYGQDRLLMAWTRINFPDGTTLELEGMGGTDAAGYAGFADQVDHHYFKIFGNAFLLGLISGATQAGVSDNNSDEVSTGESVNNGVVQQFSTVGTSLIQKNLDVQPTIKIRNGYKFNVMLNKDVVLPPYQPQQ